MKLQQFRKFSPASYIQPGRTQYIIPAFTLDVPTWTGASDLLVEYALGNSVKLAFKKPVVPFGENFVAAVRWTDGEVYYRFLFWTDTDAVLFFPVYNGETIAEDATIEIWSVNSTSAPTLTDSEVLNSSVLTFPTECNSCCQQPSSEILLVQTGPIILPPGACNPFCPESATTGACTVGGECSVMTEAACTALGGTYAGDGTTCPSIPPVPNQPAWPIPTPWEGSATYGPIQAPDAAFPSFYVGVNPGDEDPTVYTDNLSPGATAAWVQYIWEQFINDVPSYSSARIIWQYVNLSGTNYTGYSVFPDMNPDNYGVSILLTYSPVVEYII